MIKALAKATMLVTCDLVPGGGSVYRTATRGWAKSQTGHIRQMARTWPEFVRVWTDRAGVRLDGADIWVHEGGYTPFPFFLNFLLTGKAGCVTNRLGRLLPGYYSAALRTALGEDLKDLPISATHRDQLREASRGHSMSETLKAIRADLVEECEPARVPLREQCADLVHSAGVLEHYGVEEVDKFAHECFRVLRPGGVASHVIDLRDHLWFADRKLPFLNHLRFKDSSYEMLFGRGLTYHNRLLAPDYTRLFHNAGFRTVVLRRLVLPHGRYVEDEHEAMAGEPGIDRKRLAPRFGEISDVDLRTAAIHIVLRRI